jgi:hypothetical protein
MAPGPKRMFLAVTSALLVAAGFAGGWLANPPARPPTIAPISAEPQDLRRLLEEQTRVLTRAQVLARGASAAELQAAVRAELERASAETQPTARAETPAARPRGPALANALETIAGGIADHAWTEARAARLRELLPALDHEQTMEVLAKLTLAINGGQVRIDPEDGAPL